MARKKTISGSEKSDDASFTSKLIVANSSDERMIQKVGIESARGRFARRHKSAPSFADTAACSSTGTLSLPRASAVRQPALHWSGFRAADLRSEVCCLHQGVHR